MSIPFTLQDFLEMLVGYNTTFWPLQVVAYVLGLCALVLAMRKTSHSGRAISAILAFFWLWTGIVFNWQYFAKLYPLALSFALLFVIEGLILLVSGVLRQVLSFSLKADRYGLAGGLFVLYAMLAYPAIEYLLGRGYPQSLPFGLVPCPTTIFTLGMLLWSDQRLPRYVWVIPFVYSLTGVVPISFGLVEDIGLVAAGLVSAVMILYRDRPKAQA